MTSSHGRLPESRRYCSSTGRYDPLIPLPYTPIFKETQDHTPCAFSSPLHWILLTSVYRRDVSYSINFNHLAPPRTSISRHCPLVSDADSNCNRLCFYYLQKRCQFVCNSAFREHHHFAALIDQLTAFRNVKFVIEVEFAKP